MATVIAPSRNPTMALAWKLHKAAQKAEGKGAKKPEVPYDVDLHRALHEAAKGTPGAARAVRERKAALLAKVGAQAAKKPAAKKKGKRAQPALAVKTKGKP